MQATIRKSNKVRRSKGDVIFDTVVYIITGLMILIAIYPMYFILIASISDPALVSSCDIVIFLFKDGWIENRNPFNFSCSQILRGEHMCFGPVFFLHVGLVGTHFHEQA